ncbi:MAG: AAA family ATPase [Alphaproteobacteria bacterium]|nr:AAA family ATPase [Alphaproteobacteria bacterium]
MAKKTAPLFEVLHPMKRIDLFGHADAEKIFLDAWNNRETRPLHPVWILAGPKGIGKATLAHRIAKFVFANSSAAGGLFGPAPAAASLDLSPDSIEFQRYIDGGYPDLSIISLETDPEEKTEISVDFVRRMIDSMRVSASDDSWRVVIIDSIDDMNRNAANSLLKILEEPPAKTLFLIVAHKLASVLPTIRSRSQVLKMRVLDESDVRKILFEAAGVEADMEKLGRAAKLSDGSVARALSLFFGGGSAPDLFEVADIVTNPEAKASKLVEVAKSLATSDETLNVLLDVIHYLAAKNPIMAELYSEAAKEFKTADALNLDFEAVAFKTIRDMRKCLSIPTAI